MHAPLADGRRAGALAVNRLASIARPIGRAAEAFEILAEDRTLRLCVLFAVGAVSLPYANLVHDAQLYAFQVMNRVRGGALASDLFLKYGSQDQYTPFSWVAAPLARVIGIEWTFFLLFLVSSALLLIAIDYLVASLIADRVLRVTTVLFTAMSSMPYGGLSVFYVREAFFTPRMTGTAIAVLALACALRARYVVATCLAILATVVHPLVGAPAILVVFITVAADHLPRRVGCFIIAAITTISFGLVLYRPVGHAILGVMDEPWLALVRNASAYVVLEGWTFADWARVVAGITVVAGAGFVVRCHDRSVSNVLLAAAAIAAGGLLATGVATSAGYRLLVQAQPYRAVWLLHLLQIPAVALLVRTLWRRSAWGSLVAALALSTVLLVDFVLYEFLFACAIFLAVSWRSPRLRSGCDREMLAVAVASSALGGAVVWGAIKLSFAGYRATDVLKIAGVPLYFKTLAGCVPRFVWFGLIIWALVWLLRATRPRVMVSVIAVALAAHILGFSSHAVPSFRARLEPHTDDVAFVRRFLDARYAATSEPPTVYAGPWGDIGLVWLGLHARNYFAAVVVIFSRETAFETQRRATIVRPFELQRYQEIADLTPPVVRPLVAYFFAPGTAAVRPTADDLGRVCAPEERVDIVVLSQKFATLVAETNGRVFIYECARVRTGRV